MDPSRIVIRANPASGDRISRDSAIVTVNDRPIDAAIIRALRCERPENIAARITRPAISNTAERIARPDSHRDHLTRNYFRTDKPLIIRECSNDLASPANDSQPAEGEAS